MARRPKHFGTCHICGINGQLTFEHIPPQSAFNDRPIFWNTLDEVLGKGFDQPRKKGKSQQRGAGGYTLCKQCNNDTGAMYGRAYVDWCYQSFLLYKASEGHLSLQYPFYIYPLKVIKQIICMFFSVNSLDFRKKQPYLVKFVLNPELSYLPPEIKVYTYVMTGTTSRQSGISGILSVNNGSNNPILLSEIAFPPLGYVLTIDSKPPDKRLFDITHFSRYAYNEWLPVFLKLPVLPVHLYFPGDYRTKEEILRDRLRNEIDERLTGD